MKFKDRKVSNYVSTRAIHPRRLLDLYWGARVKALADASDLEKKRLVSTIRNSLDSGDVNKSIRQNTPNIYVVDTEYIYNLIEEALGSVTDKEEKEIRRSKVINRLNTLLSERKSAESVSMNTLNRIVKELHDDLMRKLASAEASKASYGTYRKAAQSIGYKLKDLTYKYSFAYITDPEQFISNPGPNIHVFMSHSFEILKSRLNKELKPALSEMAAYPEWKNARNLDIGNIMHSGHAGLYQGDNFLGINTPAHTIHAALQGKFQEIEQAVGNIDVHIESGIEVSENFSASGMYLDLGFQFTVIMGKDENEGLWREKESKAFLQHVKLITKQELTKAVKKNLTESDLVNIAGNILVGSGLRNSPTVPEFIINEVITKSILGELVKGYKGSTINKLPPDKIVKKSVIPKRPSPPKAKKPRIPRPPKSKSTGSATNLNTLLTLINANLAQTIRKNMGSPALNYRSGRFANSAKVERVSESRAGMITMFYNYMKNPYQTFEPGFKQGSEKRNPKTLISKSIREIAAQQVGNRLRAVRV